MAKPAIPRTVWALGLGVSIFSDLEPDYAANLERALLRTVEACSFYVEPRYRKFLEVATEIQAQLEAEDAKVVAESLRATVQRHRPATARSASTRQRRTAG